MSDLHKPAASQTSQESGKNPKGASEPISQVKRTLLKAGWVVPMIAVLSLPKNSYAVVSSGFV